MKNISFTIGIPTFNRINYLKILIAQITPFLDSKKLKIFVIDDNSSDGTDSFMDNQQNKNIKFVKNVVNMGYCLTFLNLVKETDTKYLIMAADDDFFVPDGLDKISNFIERNNPDFICTKYFLDNKVLYRGKCEESEISIRDVFACSSHAPGLVYNVEKIKPFVPYLENLIQKKSAIAYTYPQVLCVTWLLATGGSGYYMDADIISQGAECPSGIKDPVDGSYYWEPTSRIKQRFLYSTFLNDIEKDFCINKIDDFDILKKQAGQYTFENLKLILQNEHAIFFAGFLKAARQTKQSLFCRLIKLPFKFIMNPGHYLNRVFNKNG